MRFGGKVYSPKRCSSVKRKAIVVILNWNDFGHVAALSQRSAPSLWGVVDEARARGYGFDASKIARRRAAVSIPVTQGQMEHERRHLIKKLRVRDPAKLGKLRASRLKPHPMLRVLAGGIESWEVI